MAMSPCWSVSRSLHSFSSERQQPWTGPRSFLSTGSQFCSGGVAGALPALPGVCRTERKLPCDGRSPTQGVTATHGHDAGGETRGFAGAAVWEVRWKARGRGRLAARLPCPGRLCLPESR